MNFRMTGLLSLLSVMAMTTGADVKAGKLQGEITLDGKLDEAVWKETPAHSDFKMLKGRNKQNRRPTRTEFRIICDENHIYIGLRCEEKEIRQLVKTWTAGPSEMWQNDAVEIFLAPCGRKEKYYQFALGAANSRFVQYYEEAGNTTPETFGGRFDSAVFYGDDFWSAEIRIPLTAFYHTPHSEWSTKWLVNVTRSRPKAGEYATWSPLLNKYHEPGSFRTVSGFPAKPAGQIASIATADAALTRFRDDRHYDGKFKIRIDSEKAAENLHLNLHSEQLDKDAGQKISLKRGKNSITIPAEFKQPGKMTITMELKNSDDKVLAERQYVLNAKYEPIRIAFDRPFYSQCFFPGQDASRIKGRVLVSADIHEIALSSGGETYRLPVRGGVAAFDIQNTQTEGKIVLKAEFEQAGKKTAQTQTVRILKPTGRKMVWIESPRRLVINGKRSFGFGWYGGGGRGGFRISQAFADKYPSPAAKHPFNFGSPVMMTAPQLLRGTPVSTEYMLDTVPSEIMKKKIRQRIEQNSQRDFDYYYLADEPEFHNVSAVYLEHMYKLIKELDPFHPVMIITTRPEVFIDCADILNPHIYIKPIVDDRGRRTLGTPVSAAADAARQILHSDRKDKLIFGTPQVFNYRYVNQYAVFPTFDETNAWIWSLICCGGQGLTPFIYYDHASRPDLDFGVDYIYNSIDRLSDWLTGPNEAVKVDTSDKNVETSLIEAERGILLIAVNVSPEKQSLRISSPVLKKYTELFRFREEGKQKIDGDGFYLTLDPYQVHIYSSGKLDEGLFSLSELRKKIAAAEKDRCSSPSILFEKGKRIEFNSSPVNGTDTSVPEDKLFDGVRNITGWLPLVGKHIWIELGFRKFTAKFTRLRIYGANLGVPDFSILKYGKWITLKPTEVKREKYLLELNFGQKYSTVKCRIDWKKWIRDFEIYEIELIP